MIANASCHRRFEHQRAAVKNGLQNEESKDLLQPSLSFRFGLSVETTRCTERVKMLRNSVRAFRRLRTFNVHTRKLGKIAGSATNASEEKTATSKNAESNELKKRKTAEENEGAGKKESQGPSTRGHKEPTRYGDWDYARADPSIIRYMVLELHIPKYESTVPDFFEDFKEKYWPSFENT
eukprot:jgi/Bigna1/136348/aug1.33_g11056